MQQEKFDQWGIIELFGHQQIAGRISEQQIGGASFVRVDVPETKKQKGYTKLFGSGAIYGISITDEETARAAAGYYQKLPIEEWRLQDMKLALESPGSHGERDYEDE
jgi:hypothetical protein